MLNWGDKDAAERLAVQLGELLRDRTMTFDQLASCYSIKQGQSVTQRLKEMSRDRRPMSLADFIAVMSDHFEGVGAGKVRARKAPDAVAGSGGTSGYPVGRGAAPAAAAGVAAVASPPSAGAPMKYADVSRAIQNILKEHHEPVVVGQLEELFLQRHGSSIPDIAGMSTGEYLERKENIFDYNPSSGHVFLQSAILTGPPMADPSTTKDEAYVVRELEQLIETMGPVVYISTLCGKFIQRNGVSVSSVISTRPLDLFKRHPSVFLIVGAGNVTLKKYEHLPEVQRLLEKPDKPSSKALRMTKAAEEAQLPLPDVVTEAHVVQEFRRLILADGTDSVYISSLCGRFLQRFKQPVTADHQLQACRVHASVS